MTIIRQTTLLAAPEPAFVGSEIRIILPDARTTFAIAVTKFPSAGQAASVDWGDGTSEGIGTEASPAHVYARSGAYRVRLRNVSTLGIVSADSGHQADATSVVSFVSNDPVLEFAAPNCFSNCSRMTHFDVDGANLTTILPSAFSGCSALTGEIRLPRVRNILGSKVLQPFSGCTGLSNIRFAAANAAAVRSSAAYLADPTLGAANATIRFDL